MSSVVFTSCVMLGYTSTILSSCRPASSVILVPGIHGPECKLLRSKRSRMELLGLRQTGLFSLNSCHAALQGLPWFMLQPAVSASSARFSDTLNDNCYYFPPFATVWYFMAFTMESVYNGIILTYALSFSCIAWSLFAYMFFYS